MFIVHRDRDEADGSENEHSDDGKCYLKIRLPVGEINPKVLLSLCETIEGIMVMEMCFILRCSTCIFLASIIWALILLLVSGIDNVLLNIQCIWTSV